jgi:acetyltransferase
VRLLLHVSTMVCALPWIVEVELDPLFASPAGTVIAGIRIVVDHRRAKLPRYAHLAIHPYPAELVQDVVARDGSTVHVRPIRPEDAEMEREFVHGLSEQTRYFRFFYRMHELSPAMLARFTQVDYDREMALVGVVDDRDAPEGKRIVGVARYIQNPDLESAEYAIVVADDWHGRGLGALLIGRLADVARRKGLKRLEGAVLRENASMVKFVSSLGFEIREDPFDGEQYITTYDLTAPPAPVAAEATA